MNKDVSSTLLRQAVAASTDGFAIADARAPDFPLIFVNPAFERLTGYRAHEVLGKNCRFLQGSDTQQPAAKLLRAALASGTECSVTMRNYRKDGSMFWNELSLAPIRDRAGSVSHFLGTLSDVTARVVAERQLVEKQRQLERAKLALESLAVKDALTGLYNRRHFAEQLEREWNRAQRERVPVSLLMIDIDRFKRFNDSYGHIAGDQCLRAVADAVRRCFGRGSDLVARFGGEEFVVLTAGVERAQARQRAELVHRAISEVSLELQSGRSPPSVTASVGVATAVPGHRALPEDLLAAADRALYQAKRQGRDRVVQAPALAEFAHAA